MNQEQLARLVGITQASLSKAERGVLVLSIDVQSRLATALGVSLAELFPSTAREAVA